VAVLVLISSLFWLLMGLLGTVVVLNAPSVNYLHQSPWVALIPLWIMAALSSLGVTTAVGLFRLKNWARISTLIFSLVLVSIGVGGPTGVFLVAPAAQEGTSRATALFVFLGSLSAFVIGSWWLYLFNKSTVKAQFIPVSERKEGRPLSVTLISLLFLFGAIQFLLLHIRRSWAPTFFGFVVSGWVGIVVAFVSVAIQLYSGIGLFRLQEMARKVAMGYLIYGVVSALLFIVLPGSEGRFTASLAQLPPGIQASKISLLRMSLFGFLMMAGPNAVQVWFLVKRRWAFQRSR